MIIVADEQIMGLKNTVPSDSQLITLPAAKITADQLKRSHADVLLIRSVTWVNAELLQKTSIKWVGTLTSGIDHLDVAWLAAHDISWANAPGANAIPVVEYVLSVIAALQLRHYLPWQSVKAGVIGAGEIGSRVVKMFQKMGFDTRVNDPLKALAIHADAEPFVSTPLTEFYDLDLICVHPELTRDGEFPSYHLLDDAFFKRQKTGCVLINAARGEIIETAVLRNHKHLILCLDVWEHEPTIDLALLQQALIATPHIAGYSKQAKQRALSMVCQTLWPHHFLGTHADVEANSNDYKQGNTLIQIDASQNWQPLVVNKMNLFVHTQTMREHLLNTPIDRRGQTFEALRRTFANRDEFIDID